MRRSNWYHVRSVLRQVWRHPSNRGRRVRAEVAAIRWQAHNRLRPEPRDVDYFGLKLRCHPKSNSASNVIYFTERFDPLDMSFLEAWLQPGDTFVDVGANIGTYSLLAETLVGPDGHVIAFEPDAVTAGWFRENVQLNQLDGVELHEAAVSSAAGTTDFLTGFDVSNSILTAADAGEATVQVPTVTLDAVLAGRPAALAKVDVEGFEVAVLNGATERLAAADPPVWMIEVMSWQLAKAGSTPDELLETLADHGFEAMVLLPTAPHLGPLPPDYAGNIVAIHHSALEAVRHRLTT